MKNISDNEMTLVNMVIDAYVKVMGTEKWNTLSAEQQYDVIMTILKDLDKAVIK